MEALLFVGGTRCGKSSLALRWAESRAGRRLFVATCVPEDAEMMERVGRHRAGRGSAWECLEEGIDPQKALEARFFSPGADRPGVLLFDCVSMWIANMLYAGLTPDDALSRVDLFAEYLTGLGLPAALVSAEAGLGIVPANPVGRRFQDTLGLANQRLARACRTVILVRCGLPLPVKGALPEGLC
ncbi:MAG: bifunctional adenosylcobinamide kinase/adenosylcobinamide-phosphate guanylyltransferase [Desulfovibrio sp.]|jgi:adenosylcobinamide kinase/adenosylcobinamide-phosphate guanylyltransferase|nr:bifunctional adenosylcobinamide kinase/adenosylcobinamide-phosphate guanylyltransferase [Desulfovibrio sp.]